MAEQERDGSVDRISITLERAVQFANSLTHEYVTLEHLLFSIIEEEDGRRNGNKNLGSQNMYEFRLLNCN